MKIKNILKQVALRAAAIVIAPLIMTIILAAISVVLLIFFAALLLGTVFGSIFYGWEYLDEI